MEEYISIEELINYLNLPDSYIHYNKEDEYFLITDLKKRSVINYCECPYCGEDLTVPYRDW